MTPDELTALRQRAIKPVTISAYDLRNDIDDRTLAYGYDTDRKTWHCYLADGEIHVIQYWGTETLRSDITVLARGVTVEAVRCRPNKRVYPESVDFQFAMALLERGVELPYTNFHDEMVLEGRPSYPFWGWTGRTL